MTDYRSPVDAILEAVEPVVPESMDVGLKFTSPTQTTYGGYQWPNPGEWAETTDGEWNPTLCKPGGFHAATTFDAAQSGDHSCAHAMLVAWYPAEAVTDPHEPGKVKASRMLSLCRIDMIRLIRDGHLTNTDLAGAYLSGAYLSWANLHGTNLHGTNLHGTNLSRTNLSGADLSRTNLSGADLTEVRYNDKTVWPEGLDMGRLV